MSSSSVRRGDFVGDDNRSSRLSVSIQANSSPLPSIFVSSNSESSSGAVRGNRRRSAVAGAPFRSSLSLIPSRGDSTKVRGVVYVFNFIFLEFRIPISVSIDFGMNSF